MLELREFSCERDNRLLFAGLSAQFNAGEIWHVAGPNGVGKTSLLRQLTGISREHGGELLWQGQPVRDCRYQFAASLLYIGHQPGIKAALTARENLQGYCPSASNDQIEQALTEIGLYGFEDVGCYRLSAGQLRRVALSRLALSAQPLWILDEPFTALDVQAVEALEQRFVEHAATGGCVIMTTHQKTSIDQVKVLALGNYLPEVRIV